MGTFVERFGYISKPLLASSVPYIQSNIITIGYNPLDLKINPNGTQVLIVKFSFTISD